MAYKNSPVKSKLPERSWQRAAYALFGILLILILATFMHYGTTWDEIHSSDGGRYFLQWYSSPVADPSQLPIVSEGNHRYYGSFFNGLAVLMTHVLPFGFYDTIHLMSALFGLMGIVFAYRLGKHLAGTRAGLFSALALALTPVYYGHQFNNMKDIPFGALFIVSLYYLIRSYDELPKPRAKTLAALATAIGLTLGIRVGAVFLFVYVAVLDLAWLGRKYFEQPTKTLKELPRYVKGLVLAGIQVLLASWLLMLVWWPYGQLGPIKNVLDGIQHNAKFTDWPFTVFFQGQFIQASAIPGTYLPVWFGITLPEFYFLVLGAAGIASLRFISARSRKSWNLDRAVKLGFLGFATLFPIVVAIAMKSVIYDANRHFLFVIPPLAVLLGVGLSALLDLLKGKKAAQFVLVGAVSLSAVATLSDMVRLHPYETVFFNRVFGGGLKEASQKFETDYWGNSYREGMRWLIENYRKDAAQGSIRVANTSARHQTEYYIQLYGKDSSRFVAVEPWESPHIVLSTTRWNRHQQYAGKTLHVVERMGVPLLYIIETRAP